VYYDKALAIDPNYVDALNNKAKALASLNARHIAVKGSLFYLQQFYYLFICMAFSKKVTYLSEGSS
jgi:hypothetical protein